MRYMLSRKAETRWLRYWRTHFVLVLGSGLVFFAVRAAGQGAAQQQGTESSGPRLKVTSNLVLVRVVVSDASGRAVLELHEGDFKIFDRGKEQSIVHFEVESPAATDKSAAGVTSPGQISIAPASEASGQVAGSGVSGARASGGPANFVALYFDNLSTTDADLVAARKGAEQYLLSSLKPSDRVAIFSSEQILADI